MKKQKKDYLIIDRSKWRTDSHGKGDTLLLNNEGYMCCLGFRCHQMGIPKKEILNICLPYYLSYKWIIPDLIDENGCTSQFSEDAAEINDDPDLTNKERERLIIEHFKTKDIIVKFVGRYKK